MSDHIARATTTINAEPERVWAVLTDLSRAPEYMLGSRIDTDWQPGSAIVWSGEYDGKAYRDHGAVLEARAPHVLSVSHFSPLSGLEDRPENYHTLTFELEPAAGGTVVTLTQDNNPTIEAMEHSERNWRTVVDALKQAVEEGHDEPEH